MKNQPVVVGLGEVLWDIFPDGKRLGGAPANFAYHAAQQGNCGIVVSAIGDDELGREIEKNFEQKQLTTEYLARVVAPTGTVRVLPDAQGAAHYVFAENCAWDEIPFSAKMKKLAASVSVVCFGSLAQRDERSRASIRKFLDGVPETALRVFDVNLRQDFFSKPLVLESVARANVLKINEDEFPVVADFCGINPVSREAFFRELFGLFPRLRFVVLTLGKAGSETASRDGARSRVFADSRIRVVDTVGAGDAFTAGFVSALLAGKTLREAHLHAAALADFVCSRAGAMPDVPAEFRRL